MRAYLNYIVIATYMIPCIAGEAESYTMGKTHYNNIAIMAAT